MPVRLVLDGFDEFARSLADLPTTLTEQAKTPVKVAADDTMQELLAGYPEKSGAMKAGVKQVPADAVAHYAIDVMSTAPHAHLWEYGTKVRETQKQWNRGSEQGARDKALHTIEVPHQASLALALEGILRDNSFEVDGGA